MQKTPVGDFDWSCTVLLSAGRVLWWEYILCVGHELSFSLEQLYLNMSCRTLSLLHARPTLPKCIHGDLYSCCLIAERTCGVCSTQTRDSRLLEEVQCPAEAQGKPLHFTPSPGCPYLPGCCAYICYLWFALVENELTCILIWFYPCLSL